MCRKDRIEKIKKAMQATCNACEEKSGKKDIDECFRACPWHTIYNLLLDLEETV